MDHKKQLALKLQMGINPTLQIEPNLLWTMWCQLKKERESARSHRRTLQPNRTP